MSASLEERYALGALRLMSASLEDKAFNLKDVSPLLKSRRDAQQRVVNQCQL